MGLRQSKKFKALAKSRGVNLSAEEARATQQIKSGQTIRGTSKASQVGMRYASMRESQLSKEKNVANTYISSANTRNEAAAQMQSSAFNKNGVEQTRVTAGVPSGRSRAENEALGLSTTPSTVDKIETALGVESLGGQHYLAALGLLPAMSAISTITKTISNVAGTGSLSHLARSTASKFATNGATKKLISSAAGKITLGTTWKVAGAVTLGLFIAEKILTLTLGGKNFGEFVGMEEASQTVNIAGRDALMNGDFEGYQIAADARDEVLREPTFWENLKSYIPFVNMEQKLDDYREAAITAGAVYDKIAEDKRVAAETGETEADTWARAKDEQAIQEKALIDYYNEQRKLLVQWEREASKDARNDDAKFWADQRDAEREKEEADRIAIAKFWEEYRRQLLKLQEASRPSNLKFGLL